jgi:ParB-like chromosome segregation protein Spo0J
VDELRSALLRDIVVEQCSLTNLKTNPRNARTHSKRQIKAIAASIEQFGFTTPLLIDDDGMILAGHGRLQAAKLLGLDRVPTIRISGLSEAEKRAFVLAENRLAQRAGWNRELLALELGELSYLLPDLGLTVDLTGFEVREAELIVNATEQKAVDDEDDDWPAAAPTTVSRAGDLWLLGKHRLLCAHPADRDAVWRLLEGKRADLVFSEPRYARNDDGCSPGEPHAQRDAAALTLLQQAVTNAAAASKNGAMYFLCTDWRHLQPVLSIGQASYGALVNIAVWVKDNVSPGVLFDSQHQLIAIFRRGDAEDVKHVERRAGRRSNVWRYPGKARHVSTELRALAGALPFTPVALVADAIRDVSRGDALVLDLFGGSGTTLIAAERSGCQAMLLEHDPRCVDLIIARFEKLSRTEAIHEETGRTFAKLSRERID